MLIARRLVTLAIQLYAVVMAYDFITSILGMQLIINCHIL